MPDQELMRLTKLLEITGAGWGHRGAIPVSSGVEGTFDHPLGAGYFLEGRFLEPPCVGRRMVVLRINRNGILRLGLFTSSEVTLVGEHEIHTVNSVYQIETL